MTISHLTKLIRPRLSFLNGVTAVAGYNLFPAPLQWQTLLSVLLGVTLLAMGGSAFNQVLERRLDAVMTRTMGRPLPGGVMSASTAVSVGSCAILSGLFLLGTGNNHLPQLLGVIALVWYLLVYTPLKPRTTLALPLGALCGAFPPLIGWSIAGGESTDYHIVILSGLLFIWQIPHFWLLQERHAADYRRAGIPLAPRNNWLMALWLVAMTAAAIMLPLFGMIERSAPIWYALLPVPLALLTLSRSRRLLFAALNLFPLLVTLAIIRESL